MNNTEVARVVLASSDKLSAILIALLISSASPIHAIEQELEPPWLNFSATVSNKPQTGIIKVGVRADAQPFSYRSDERSEEPLLANYGGYMIEVCRRVLTHLVADGPFKGYDVLTTEVNAADRFDKLTNNKVDVLCGPNSITLERLELFNASHPVFLSGVTYASVAQNMIPPGPYCGAIIGLLENTTSQTEGLKTIAESNELLRFDRALEAYFSEFSGQKQPEVQEKYHAFLQQVDKDVIQDPDPEDTSAPSGETKVWKQSVKTPGDCTDGYEHGPVVYYDSHDKGLDDLCKGLILYYLGDVDILKSKLADRSCDYIMRRETMTREAYGVYFRQPEHTRSTDDALSDGQLYAEFSNVLLRKMQSMENILDYEYHREFKDKEMTKDLMQFFESFKFATDY